MVNNKVGKAKRVGGRLEEQARRIGAQNRRGGGGGERVEIAKQIHVKKFDLDSRSASVLVLICL